MASCRSDLAAEIKERLTARQVIEFYGFHPNRTGYIQCPFHTGDDHGSLKVYDGKKSGWHCFGCGAGSTVIDFVMKLFNINFRQACLRLDVDFSLGLTGEKPSAAEVSAVLAARRQEAERKAEADREYGDVTPYQVQIESLNAAVAQKDTQLTESEENLAAANAQLAELEATYDAN